MNCLRYWVRYVHKGEVKGGEVVLAIRHLLGYYILGKTSQRWSAPITKFNQLRAWISLRERVPQPTSLFCWFSNSIWNTIYFFDNNLKYKFILSTTFFFFFFNFNKLFSGPTKSLSPELISPKKKKLLNSSCHSTVFFSSKSHVLG